MSGSNNEQMKQGNEPENLSPSLIQLMTKLIEQNSVLIDQSAAKEQLIMQLIEQNDDILNELIDQGDDVSSKSLDMD